MVGEIKKGVPIPIGRLNSLASRLRMLKVGDNVLVLESQRVVLTTAKRLGIKITTRKVEGEGLEVWRIEKKEVTKSDEKPVMKVIETSEPIKTNFESAKNNPAMEKWLAQIEAKKPVQKEVKTEVKFKEDRVIEYD